MKIVLNLTILHSGGAIQVARSVLDEWEKFENHEYCVIISKGNSKYFLPHKYAGNFVFYVIKYSPNNHSRIKFLRSIRSIEKEFNPDVVFTLFGPPYWRPKAPHLCGYALPHHIYRELPYISSLPILKKLRLKVLRLIQFNSFKRDCDYYVTETLDVSTRLSNHIEVDQKSIFTVNNAYNGIFDDQSNWLKDNHKISAEGFKMITISSFYPHKNLTIIPRVINYLSKVYPEFKYTFILTIDSDKLENLSTEQVKHIQFIGKVRIEECPSLYQQSDALFMPTLLECFTVSYLEAMKMERPILTSDLSFARELCGTAALYFDPLDPKSIGESIYELAHNKLLQKRLKIMGSEQLKKYGSAQDRAIAYLDILEQIHGNNTSKN